MGKVLEFFEPAKLARLKEEYGKIVGVHEKGKMESHGADLGILAGGVISSMEKYSDAILEQHGMSRAKMLEVRESAFLRHFHALISEWEKLPDLNLSEVWETRFEIIWYKLEKAEDFGIPFEKIRPFLERIKKLKPDPPPATKNA